MFEPAAQLRSLLVDVDDPDLAEDDAKVVEVTCRCVSRARGQIVSVGLWERPLRDPPRCQRAGCQGEDGKPRVLRKRDGRICGACQNAMARARKAPDDTRGITQPDRTVPPQ